MKKFSDAPERDCGVQSVRSVSLEQTVYNFIRISNVPKSEKISDSIGVPLDDIRDVLLSLESDRRIRRLNHFGGRGENIEGCKWQIRR